MAETVRLRLVKTAALLTIDELAMITARHGLAAHIVGGLIAVESSWRRHATRYEPAHQNIKHCAENAKKLGISLPTEQIGQKTSWGLMQVMGSTARLLGFKGLFPQLCEIDTGIEYGCRYLAWQYHRYNDMPAALSAYNAGTAKKGPDEKYINQDYVDKVLKAAKEFR